MARRVKRHLTLTVQVDGLRETLAAFNRLPKEASRELRERTKELAGQMADSAAAAALADTAPQSRLLAPTVKARKDRVPTVAAGGTRRVGRRRAPAFKVLFGSEFGSNRFTQFGREHSGRDGNWFFPTVEREAPAVADAWRQVADRIIRDFTRDGG